MQDKKELDAFVDSMISFASQSKAKFIVYGLLDPISKALRYIGRSSNGLVRPKKHIWNMSEQKTRYAHLRIYRWIESLRREELKPLIIVLSECSSQEEVSSEEIRWIALSRQLGCDLTNLSDGGEGNLGHKNYWKGKRRDLESIQLVANKTRGKRRTLEQRQEMSNQRKGREVSKGTREKLSKINKHKKPIQDNFGNSYESTAHAAAQFGYSSASITRSLKNPNALVAGKFKFTYLNPKDKNREATKPIERVIDQHGNIYNNVKDAATKLNISTSSIYGSINRENRTASGYILKYVKEEI